MRAVRAQYFLAFAVQGSLLPYLSVLLAEKGLGDAQIGDVTSLTGLAILFGPVTLTLLADLRLESRRLLALAFAGAGAMLLALLWAEAFWSIMLVFGIYAVLALPILQVQDGLNFALQQQRRDRGDEPVPYHRIRVWGTIGFIVPALVLYAWLQAGAPVSVTLIVAAVFAGLGLINARWLPAVHSSGAGTGPPPPDAAEPTDENGRFAEGASEGSALTKADASSEGASEAADTAGSAGSRPRRAARVAGWARQLPTLAAARAMLAPPTLAFLGAMWLCHLAAAGYYTFYPIYLTRQVGIGEQWLGLIANIGVTVEIGFVLAFGVLVSRLGLPVLMALAAMGTALRLGLLFAWPNVWVAVGTQLLHGLTVLLIHIGPPVYLNQRAAAGYRSSIQGLYAMLIYGTGRIVGNLLAGRVAEWNLLAVFGFAAVLCVVAAGMFAFVFSDHGSTAREAI